MIASTWYCIAQTSTFDTGCTINVAFDGYDIQFSASVRFGMSAINITRCNIPYDTVFSLRLREGASQWFVDIFCNKEITPNVTIADSPYWTEVSTPAGAGNIVLSLNDITSKYNTEQGGAGGFDVDQLKQFLLYNGYTALLDYWKIDEVDNTVLRTDYNVVSREEIISQRRATGAGSGTGSGYGRLDNWAEWDADTMLTYVLSAKLGVSLNERLKNIELNGSGLKEDDLKKYLDDNKYLQEGDIAELKATVDGLDDLLNGGTKEVIDTWNEVVSFLDGYKDSEDLDLATILSGMNTDIANRVLIEDFEKLEEDVRNIDITSVNQRLTTLEGGVKDLNGYFTLGKANFAIKDKNGNDIVDTYATKISVQTIADNLADVTGRVDVAEDTLKTYGESIAKNIADIAANSEAIGKLDTRVTTLEDLGLVRVKEGNSYYIKSIYSFVSEGEIISGRRASGSGSGGGGGISEITAQMVVDALGYVPYSSLNPAGYITSSALNGYAKTSDIPSLRGYATETWVSNNYQPKGNYLTSVSWDIVSGKPSFATVATSGKYSDLSGTPSSLPASDVYAWAKAATKPSYTASEVGALSTSGGVLDLTTFGEFVINSKDANVDRSAIIFKKDAELKAQIGWDNYTEWGTYMYNYPSDRVLGIKNDGTPHFNGYPLYHTGNFNPADYLAKSGGFISSSGWRNQLNILRAEAGDSVIGFFNQNTDNYLGAIGFDNDSNLIVNVKNVGNANILHSGNYTSYAIPSYDGIAAVYNPSMLNYSKVLGISNGNLYLGFSDVSTYNIEITGSNSVSLNTINGTKALNVVNNGNVLIGTIDDDGHKLRVSGRIKGTGYHLDNTDAYYCGLMPFNMISSGGDSRGIWLYNTAGLHFYGSIIEFANSVNINGNLIATGEVISLRRASSSDARLKDNINRLIAEDCLAMVRNLQPSSWDWKENGEHAMGFIAQDVEQYMPYAVTKIKDDVLGQRLNLQYDQFLAPVVGAIQCLDIEVEQLKKRVKYLENKLQEYGYNRH